MKDKRDMLLDGQGNNSPPSEGLGVVVLLNFKALMVILFQGDT
jgi:hypothetical protein